MNHRNLPGFLNPMLRAAQRAPHERWLAGIAGALGAFAPVLALANPTGGQVVAGTATIGSAGGNGVIVNQNSQRAAINWQQFSIGANEYVQFNQPNSSSVVLNRVTGSNPSSIFGSIRANGQVFLINPNGILFAPGSSLDVSGLAASTLDISDSDFMAGHYVFSRDPGSSAATVVNQGNVTVTRGGYVVLAGDYVENDGVIQAQSGKVLLAAGGGATLTLDNSGGLISYTIDAPTLARLAGVDNAGTIVADGGTVVMTADVANALTATAVNNSGFITAHSVSEQGGEIVLLSQGGDIENSGSLDASAAEDGVQGGTVILRGNKHTQLTDTSVIDTEGDGAKGGYIELSGHTLEVHGQVTAGKGGAILFDPGEIDITAGNGINSVSGGTNGTIGTGYIAAHLNAGSNVAIVASSAVRNITGTHITATGSGKLTIETGTVGVGGSCGFGGICIAPGGTPTITPGGGTIDLTGLPISIAGALTIHAGTASGYSGNVTLDNVTASLIRITGEKITTGNLTATSAAINAILVRATGSSDNGGFIKVNGNVIASHGGVAVIEHGGSGISITGKLTAAFSHASLSASSSRRSASVKVTGQVSGPQVNITAKGRTGASVIVGGALTATLFDVNITASDVSATNSHAPAKIATGAITAAKNVTLTAVGGSQGGAQITTGAITAYTVSCSSMDCNGGNVDITASNGAVSVGGAIKVKASVANPGSVTISGRQIIVSGNVTGPGGVSLAAFGPSHNGGSLHVAGSVVASSGLVRLVDLGGKGIDVIGSINAAGNVQVSASSVGGFHTTIKTGNITAGGSVTLHYSGGGASTGTTVKVGNVDSQKQMTFSISDASNVDSLLVKTGTLTNHAGSGSNGQGIRVTLTGKDPLFSAAGMSNLAPKSSRSCECGAANIDVTLNTTNGSAAQLKVIGGGTIKSTHGNVDLEAANGSIDVGNVSGHNIYMNGRSITFGNVTATSSVSIDAGTTAHSGATITALSGTTISARFINIDMTASYGGNIDLANLTASSTEGSAGITLIAHSSSGDTKILVNGDITVSGVGANNGSLNQGISSGMPLGGAPMAAYLAMTASGSSGAAHTIKVTGAINVTGHPGQFSGNRHLGSCECGNAQFHGNGGAASVSVLAEGNSGNVQLLGTTTVKGTDANVRVSAEAIETGALNVTGSGHTFHVTATDNAGHTFSSHNNVGLANVTLQNSSGDAAATIVTGNVTVSGKGSAALDMDGMVITAGNISVTASKASGSRHSNESNDIGQHYGLNPSLPGLFGFRMVNGSFSAGRASVVIGQNSGEGGGGPEPAQSVKTGSITVSAVGEADIEIVGNIIQTGSLNATAAAGNMKGSVASSGEAGHYQTTFNVKGGQANIEVDTGSGAATAITINGGVTASGPVASVNLFGHTIKVSKGIAVTGKGGQVTFSASGTGGSGYSSAVEAPGPITGITMGGVGSTNAGSINVGGTVSAKGPGIIGVAITAAKVTLGGLSASASNVETYKLKNTTDGINDTFTADSVAILVLDESGGAITGPANINGNVTISAPHGNVTLASELNVTGQVKVTGKAIDTTNASTVIERIEEINLVTGGGGDNDGPYIPSSGALAPKITAAGINMTATAGSIDLTGATLATPTTGTVTLKASKDVILSGTLITTGIFTANAAGSIDGGIGGVPTAPQPGLKLNATGVSMVAGGSIDLNGATVTTPGVMALKAGKDIILSGVTLKTGTLAADAGSTIHNGGAIGTITTKALALVAGKNINLSSTHITVGSGVVAPLASNAALTAMFTDPAFVAAVTGDPTLLGGLAVAGLAPAAPDPNAVFKAGNTVTLGTLTLTGSYLYLQASSVSLLGPVTVPKGTVVQFLPNGVVGSIDAEGTGAAGATLNLNDTGLFNVFPDGITLVLGGVGQSGAVTLGSNGPFNIGSDNLIVDTTGTIMSLGNVISTGQVVALSSLLTGVPPVTAAEIDPTSDTTTPSTDKDKHQQGADADGEDSGTGGTISQDTGNSSVCH